MGVLDNIVEEIVDIYGGADSPFGAAGIKAAADKGIGTDKPSGSAPSSIEKIYKSTVGKESDKNLWYIDGQDWHKIYGYRFSVAMIDPKNYPKANINSSLKPAQVEAEAAVSAAAAAGAATANAAAAALGIPTVPLNPNPVPVETSLPPDFKHFTLPIPPQSMAIKPILPSRITPSVGGVVEEVSEVKLWTVSMSGTTGIAPSQSGVADFIPGIKSQFQRTGMAKKFREVIETTGLKAGKFAEKNKQISELAEIDQQIEAANAVVQAGIDGIAAFDDGDVSGALGATVAAAGAAGSAVKGATDNSYLPPLPYASSGVDKESNGYTEAQELQKFFFMYHALKGRYPNHFALIFTNIKTDQAWRCVVKDFILQQSAQNPNLLRYKIDLQCWDVGNINDFFGENSLDKPFDRFGPGGDLAAVSLITNPEIISTLKLANDP